MKTNVRCAALFAFLLLPGTVPLFAQLSLTPSPLIWGADLQITYPLGRGELPTTPEIGVAAAYSSTPYFRNPDGSLFERSRSGFDGRSAPYFDRTLTRWNLGVNQAVVYDELKDIETVGVFVRYVGFGDWHHKDKEESQLIYSSDFAVPEAEGQLLNTLRLGVNVGNVAVRDVSAVRVGWDGYIVGEWGPAFLGNEAFGEANFARVGGLIRGFLPLYEASPRVEPGPSGDTLLNQFALYAGAYMTADHAGGSRVPLSARRSIIGPLNDRHGLGGSVRGYEAGRYDATTKIAGGAELRAVLPAVAHPGVLPGLVAYFDAGAWRGLADMPGGRHESGIAAGTGGGVSISLFDLATLVFYSDFALVDELVAGGRFTPLRIGFGYHF